MTLTTNKHPVATILKYMDWKKRGVGGISGGVKRKLLCL
jgi:hypothetical protein